MKVALVEFDIAWQKPEINLEWLNYHINSLETDLIVLPEMFSSGFSMNPETVSEQNNKTVLPWMISKAKELNSAICGSLAIKENGYFFNRFYWVNPKGEVKFYDKKQLFTLAGENKVYQAGNQSVTIDFKGFKIQPFICYDLRFPVWCKNVNDADIQIFVANWPDKRIDAWDILLKARAIENQCFVIGVNRIGLDDNALKYPGHSAVFDPMGNKLEAKESKATEINIFQANIDLQLRKNIRKKLPFLDDSDSFLKRIEPNKS